MKLELDFDEWDYVIQELKHHYDENHSDNCEDTKENPCMLRVYLERLMKQMK